MKILIGGYLAIESTAIIAVERYPLEGDEVERVIFHMRDGGILCAHKENAKLAWRVFSAAAIPIEDVAPAAGAGGEV